MNKSVTIQSIQTIDLNNNKDKQQQNNHKQTNGHNGIQPKHSQTLDNISKLNENLTNNSTPLKTSESFARHLLNIEQGRYDDP